VGEGGVAEGVRGEAEQDVGGGFAARAKPAVRKVRRSASGSSVGSGAACSRPSRSPERLESALKRLATHGGRSSGRTVDATDKEQLAEYFGAVGAFDHLVLTTTPRGGVTPVAELDGRLLTGHAEGNLPAHLLTVPSALGTPRADGSITPC
jgi:hypothetical protein